MKRVWFLDLLRAIAISAVVLFHCLPVAQGQGFFSDILARLVESLWWGVDLFFVLSGYLITTLLWETRSASNRVTVFLVRRVLRIFPLYFTWLAIVFAFNAAVPRESISALRPYVPYFATYTTNFWILANHSWFPTDRLNHLWSLAVEEQFYLLWPFAVFFLRRTQLITVTFSAIVLMQLLKLWLLATGVAVPVAYTFFLTRADSLLCGAVAAFAVLWWKPSRKAQTGAACVFISAFLVAFGIAGWKGFSIGSVTASIGTSALAWLFASAISLVLREDRTFQMPVWFAKLVSGVVALSYGAYLSHWIVWQALNDFLPSFHLAHPIVRFLTAVTSIAAVSTTLYFLVERPFLMLKPAYKIGPGSRVPDALPQEAPADALVSVRANTPFISRPSL